MEPLDDLPIDTGPEPPNRPELTRSRRDYRVTFFVTTAVVAAVALVAWYVWFRGQATDQPVSATHPSAPPASEVRGPLGPPVDAIDLPPLFLTDPLVRDLIGRLSNRPEVMAWLATDGLIRTLVVSIENVASGQSPARHLARLAPKAPFEAAPLGADFVIDPDSWVRYNGIADATASLDPAGLARAYSLLKPRMIEAYRELGHPEGDIDGATERAIGVLLRTPFCDCEIEVARKVVSYKFQTEELEALEPAQKHLLRMGPRNQVIIQEQLRAVARALGIPEARIPRRLPFPPAR